jgi:APA family basic amino acid/polyamine antiporter
LADQKTHTLKRSIGLWSAVAINVGAIVGGGIFVVTGIVAGYAGSAFIIAMVVAGLIAFITAMNLARLTAWHPVEGGVYEYGRQLVAPYVGFLGGWMWLVSNTFTGATVALGFAHYLAGAFPNLPVNIVAAGMCLVFMGLNLVGAQESASINNVLVGVKLFVLGFFVVFGLLYVDPTNFIPFVPFSSGVLYAVFFIFFAYGGFARVTVIAEEIKDAKRNVPRAILLSLGISMVIYVCVGLVAVGLLGAKGLSGSVSPLSTAMEATGVMWAVPVIAIGGLVATASVLLTNIFGVSRMAYSMARRGDLPSVLARLQGKRFTPYYAIIVSGLLMAGLVLFVDLTRVIAVSTFALVFTYCITNISAYKLGNGNRRFRGLALLGLMTCLMLLGFVLFASPDAWFIGVIFLFVGGIYYVGKNRYGAEKSFSQRTQYS